MTLFLGRDFTDEMIFTASRGGGPGGQNVNKVSTKVELRFHVASSKHLSDEEKTIILEKLSNKINSEGYLLVVAQAERTQLLNKQATIRKFYHLLEKALHQPKPRKATKPSQAAVRQRLTTKRKSSEKKANRQQRNFDRE